VIVEDVVTPTAKRGRGRPPKEKRDIFESARAAHECVIDFSLTVVSRGQHIPPIWLDALFAFCERYGTRGSMSLERGGRQEHLHIQACRAFEPSENLRPRTRFVGLTSSRLVCFQAIVSFCIALADLDALKKLIKEALGVRVGDGSKWCVRFT